MDINKIGTAAVELFKGNVSAAFKSLSYGDNDYRLAGPVIIDPAVRWTPDNSPWEYSEDGGGYQYFKWEDYCSGVNAYERCPPLQAVINRKAQAFTNGKTWFLNGQDKESQSSEAAKLRKLFKNPNPIQTQKQFESQLYVYMQVFGYSIVLFRKPSGFKDNIDAFNIWNIPPSMISIEETEKLFYQTDLKGIVKSIKLKYKEIEVEVNVNDIYIMRDMTPSFSSLIIPSTRIQSLQKPINNIIGAYDSRGQLVNERGALGIFTQAASKDGLVTMPMPQPEKDELQRQMRKFGTRSGQKKFIITKTALEWKQVGIAVKDLMLFEEIEADTMAICDSYNYDYRLLASIHNNSLGGSDANIFLKKLYQDSIIPEANSIYEQLGQAFGLTNIRIDKDYSHVPVLQEDETQKATARKIRNEAYKTEFELGACTLNDLKIANGEDPINEPQFNMYYDEYQKWKRDKYPVEPAAGAEGDQGQGQQGSLIAI